MVADTLLILVLRGVYVLLGVGAVLAIVRWLVAATRERREQWAQRISLGMVLLSLVYAVGHARLLWSRDDIEAGRARYAKFGDPKDPADAAYQHDSSPIHFIDKIQRPLMVVQGTNDARVKKDQSDRVVEALRKRNVPVDYLVIEGEGHGFSKTENYQNALETADRFLDKHLFGDTEVKVMP